MELVTHRKFKGDRMMPWGKGTVVTGAAGFVFLSGNTATTDDYDPLKKAAAAPEMPRRNGVTSLRTSRPIWKSSAPRLII
jgi:hypothetical protein